MYCGFQRIPPQQSPTLCLHKHKSMDLLYGRFSKIFVSISMCLYETSASSPSVSVCGIRITSHDELLLGASSLKAPRRIEHTSNAKSNLSSFVVLSVYNSLSLSIICLRGKINILYHNIISTQFRLPNTFCEKQRSQ